MDMIPGKSELSLHWNKGRISHQTLWNCLCMWGSIIFTKVPCLFHSPTCTWAETKLEVLLTCLWFGSQLGITFPAPQANPRILHAKYYWCPGTTSHKSCRQYLHVWEVGRRWGGESTGLRTSSKKSVCPLFTAVSFIRVRDLIIGEYNTYSGNLSKMNWWN